MSCGPLLATGLFPKQSIHCRVRPAGEWLDGMTAKVPRNDAPEEIEARHDGFAQQVCAACSLHSHHMLYHMCS